MLEIQKKNEFDFLLLFLCIILWIVGLFLIYSATHIHEAGPLANATKHQVIWIVMGLVTILIITSLPTRLFFSLSYVAYGLSILLLLYGFFTGVISKGAERWIVIAGIRLQPAEFAKIGLVLALGRYLSTKTLSLEKITSFIVPGSPYSIGPDCRFLNFFSCPHRSYHFYSRPFPSLWHLPTGLH
jgi:rod shape determining protein RodA